MSAAVNKAILQQICSELAKGNSAPFREAMADDFIWIVTGTTAWSGTYRGKQTVIEELLTPLRAKFATQYTNTATRFIAEEDYVVVECRGNVMTRSGAPYNNVYCWIFRLEDGKLKELTEYMDTQLVVDALGTPERAVIR